ncbi:MAG: hypothetical protein FWF07_01770 [Methanomassiliicoccaceae archaeon]|nr:hypothetical protein [Methanomassiliicoccaceae archaeon]
MAQNTGRNSTLGSALGILLLALVVIAAIVFVALNPDILKSLAYIVLIVIAIIIVIVIIVYLAAVFLALPYYAAKGETYQTGKSYDLDDIESVKEKDSREKK